MKKIIMALAVVNIFSLFHATAQELNDPTFGDDTVTVINDQDCRDGLYDPTFCEGLIIVSDLEQVKSVDADVVRLADPTFEPGAVIVVGIDEQGKIYLVDPTFEEDAIEIINTDGEQLMDPTFGEDAVTVIDGE